MNDFLVQLRAAREAACEECGDINCLCGEKVKTLSSLLLNNAEKIERLIETASVWQKGVPETPGWHGDDCASRYEIMEDDGDCSCGWWEADRPRRELLKLNLDKFRLALAVLNGESE